MVVECYQVTKQFPTTETYGLSSQIQRAAVSVPANIAEGKGRDHLGQYIHHLSIANGSLMELETHLLIAGKLSYLTPQELEEILTITAEVGRMLNGLRKTLKERMKKTT
nr:four helix bundle protein [Planktothrix pseudagardhii]